MTADQTPSAENDAPAGSRSECSNCGDPIVLDAVNGWVHVVAGGYDPVPCDYQPVAEPGPRILSPGSGGAE